MSCLRYFSAHFLRYQFQTLLEHAVGRLSFHHPALMWSLVVVVLQIAIQVCLHLLHRLIPGCPPFDTEVFIQQGTMQPFDKAVALRPAYLANSTSKCDTRLCRLTVLFEYLDRLPESETFPRS